VNGTELEGLIQDGIARTVRSQQLAGPALDSCYPGMIDYSRRKDFAKVHRDLSRAAHEARAARDLFTQAAAMIAELLEAPNA
jgi:hypothetical protein